MSTWIEESLTLVQDVGAFLISSPIFYIVGCLLLLVIVRLFKSLTGGA